MTLIINKAFNIITFTIEALSIKRFSIMVLRIKTLN